MSTWSDLKNNPRLKKIYDTRIDILKLIREFFWSQNFLETDTPIAVRLASQEPYLNPLPVTIHPPDFAAAKPLRAGDPNGKSEQFYLRTSPEYALKKLLAAGYEKIFELSKCFRDFESFGGNHNTEFTMLEWYRAPGKLQNIMDDTENLFKFVAEKTSGKILRYKDVEINIFEKWERVTMKEIWQKYSGINLDDNLTIEQLSNTARVRGYSVSEADAYEDLFFKIFLNEIEPKLGLDKPVFVYDYPAQMSSLSRLCADVRYAERFELYAGGLELANAFGELTDAAEQKKRLEEDKDLRRKLGKETWPVDPDFIEALRSGIPAGGLAGHSSEGAAAGIALGVDRMVLLFTGAKDLNEVIFQSVNDQIEK